MASLEMTGPFKYSSAQIDQVVAAGYAGNYALGHVNGDGSFIVEYVGRSDTDLNAELKAYLDRGYASFKFSYADSPKAAYEKECANFHDFGGSDRLHNMIHPAKPANHFCRCPRWPYCNS